MTEQRRHASTPSHRPTAALLPLLLVLALLLPALLVPAAAQAKYASFVMDAETGRVLHAVNADTRNFPASLTKMMTLYLTFEALESGRWSWDTELKVSARAARQPPSRLGLRAGQTITVETAVMALITKSANDVASTIAHNHSGGERAFAQVMTAKAQQIGMARTVFRNSSGLPHSRQQSTARDMAMLARALLNDFPAYYHRFSAREFAYHGHRYKNHNNLLKTYVGTDGVKTGYIRASGYNLVASAVRGGHRIIGVVFGGRSAKARDRHMATLLNKGFSTIDPALARSDYTPSTGEQVAAAAPAPAPTPAMQAAPVAAPARRAASVDRVGGFEPSGEGTGSWGVQVGAYHQEEPAFEMAKKAVALAPNYLKDGWIRVAPLRKGKRRPLYRGRILGLTRKQAYLACQVLERKKVNCMELRSKARLEVASSKD
ncbi:MAG: D-alanyl-D-alanine carboxypeptidase [Hyphomicrobiales bacterium]|nr:D-alanyl-D-alanine carboxypeptidase [Hyphomicrobiales bacterium]